MSSFVVWVLLPVLVGLGLFILRRFYLLSVSLATAFCALMALLAWRLPLDTEIRLGRFSLFVASSVSLFGRQFVLENQDRPLLIVVYLIACFWFFAAYWARAGRMLAPLGIVVIALLISALSVEPFLYAGLLITLAGLVCIPILSPPGNSARPGVLRFLTSVCLGLPFILFTGWVLTGVQARPGDVDLINRSAAMLALGFIFLMGVFPLHTWVLMISAEAHPYAAGFVFVVLPWMVSLLGLNFLDHYTWLRSDNFLLVLRWIGMLMVAVAGVWSAFETHLGKIFGYAVLMETGLILTSASLPAAPQLLFEQVIPRSVSLGVWALALTILRRQAPELTYRSVNGLGRSLPVASGALILAQFSTAGVPLLAGFPLKLTIWNEIAGVDMLAAFGLLLGAFGLMTSGLRVLGVLVTGPQENPWQLNEPREVLVLMSIAVFFLLVYGIFPQIFTYPLFTALHAVP